MRAEDMLKTEEVILRDPFILPVAQEQMYYLYGTNHTLQFPFGKGRGFSCYRSSNLMEWEGPITVFNPPQEFSETIEYWAPEVHEYQGKYYLFATFHPKGENRGTWILRADNPTGPFGLWSNGMVTPREWMSLDGTLFVDEDGTPWMVFCHEWVQIADGTICAIPLTGDLREAAGEVIRLFSASEAPWGREYPKQSHVTDGPFLFWEKGLLKMLWSSFGTHGYAMGVVVSESGKITGPWRHMEEPLFAENGGHGMRFQRFDGNMMFTVHQPNGGNVEHPVFLPCN